LSMAVSLHSYATSISTVWVDRALCWELENRTECPPYFDFVMLYTLLICNIPDVCNIIPIQYTQKGQETFLLLGSAG